MPYYRNLREYIAALEENGKLIRIRRPINKDTQLTPLVRLQFRGLPEEDRKAFLFENVTDGNGKKYNFPVLTGAMAGSAGIYALGLGCPLEEVSEKLSRAAMSPINTVLVPHGPAQDEVHMGDRLLEHGGLGEFPIPIATPGFDPAPYITAPQFVSKDPDNGILNAGMYRAMVKGPARTGVNFYTTAQGGYVHYRKYKERGKPLPAAIVVGGPPNLAYAAVSSYPVDVNEYTIAGALAGAPVEMVKCKTVDLEVPASADIVIEGFVPTGLVEPEAPFGETTGFVGPMDMNPFLEVTCITHRRDAVWMATMSQYPPSESTKMRLFSGQAALFQHLRYALNMTHVLDVGFFEEVCSGPITAIKMDGASGRARETLEAAAKRWLPAKVLIAVDKDVNVHDIRAVLLAVTMRTQPHRDYHIQTFPARSLGDYSLEPLDKLATRELGSPDQPAASRLLIDATMKWPYPPVSLPKKEFMEEALAIWKEEGLPELKLAEPWSGVSLGYWNEEHERHARAAAAGDHYLAGKDYEGKRREG